MERKNENSQLVDKKQFILSLVIIATAVTLLFLTVFFLLNNRISSLHTMIDSNEKPVFNENVTVQTDLYLIKEFDEKRSKIDFHEIIVFSNVYRVSYKNIIKRLLDTKIITASNAKYLNIFVNKNEMKENIYTERPYNYDKMLYKLHAIGLIKDEQRYL